MGTGKRAIGADAARTTERRLTAAGHKQKRRATRHDD